MKYDYLIVGAGLYGSVFAHEAKAQGKSVLVIDKRPNIAGNIYTEYIEGINVHKYGAHIFHTNNKKVWDYIIISREYSSEWKPGDEPYYPVNDEKNSALYAEYKKLADAEDKVIFGGRLGEYKYYDMDQVIAAALDLCDSELQ